jgi:hypothetical protein
MTNQNRQKDANDTATDLTGRNLSSNPAEKLEGSV